MARVGSSGGGSCGRFVLVSSAWLLEAFIIFFILSFSSSRRLWRRPQALPAAVVVEPRRTGLNASSI